MLRGSDEVLSILLGNWGFDGYAQWEDGFTDLK
jgi:hypothetical protein